MFLSMINREHARLLLATKLSDRQLIGGGGAERKRAQELQGHSSRQQGESIAIAPVHSFSQGNELQAEERVACAHDGAFSAKFL